MDIIVTICCTTYNHEKFISDAIEGFLIQKTTFPIEILIYDDASEDETQTIIKYYEKKDSRIITFLQSENQWNKGKYGLLELLFPNAKGKYIALCEGDDYWTDPYKLQKQVDFLEGNPEYGMCYTDFDCFYEKTNILKKSVFENRVKPFFKSKSYEEHLFSKGFIAPLTWLFKKDLLSILDISHKFTDGSFAMALEFYKNSKLYYMPIVTAVYRHHGGSVSHLKSSIASYRQWKGVLETQKYYLEKYPLCNEMEKLVLIRGYLDVLYILLVNEDIDDKRFVGESLLYFREIGIDMKKYFIVYRDIYNENKRLKKELTQTYNSFAYKLGKFLLKPLSNIRKQYKKIHY